MNARHDSSTEVTPIAVIGMSGRFPGAPDLSALWDVVRGGSDTITRFAPDDLDADEPALAEVRAADNYVRARGVLADVDQFDAGFFGFKPAEASLIDPQHRLWLEVAWEALEGSGYSVASDDRAIGVYAGGFSNNYLLNNILRDRQAVEEYVRMRRSSSFAQLLANDNAFLASRTAYKFDLRGPAINVQTACSTSLVAVAMAVQSLLTFESDICLVGGVCVSVPQRTGYFYQEGAIFSRDGYCRPRLVRTNTHPELTYHPYCEVVEVFSAAAHSSMRRDRCRKTLHGIPKSTHRSATTIRPKHHSPKANAPRSSRSCGRLHSSNLLTTNKRNSSKRRASKQTARWPMTHWRTKSSTAKPMPSIAARARPTPED